MCITRLLVTSVCVLFLFIGSPVLLALHSLPTRPSSDLFYSPPAGAILPVGATNVDCPIRPGRRGDLCVGHRARLHRRQDRKSTRLNSSHRCISYAVFCLKKKKNMSSVSLIALLLSITSL